MSAAVRTCIACGYGLPLTKFRRSGRGHSKTCMSCETGAASGPEEEPGTTDVLGLRTAFAIRAGFGLGASLDADGDLVLTQETAEGTASIYLNEFEVHRLMSELQTRLEGAK
jgi:hypothetical protein